MFYTNTYEGKIVGKKTFVNKTKEGKEYESVYYCIVYKTDADYIEGYNVECIRSSNKTLTAGEYKLTICTQRTQDKTYRELIAVEPLNK